MDDFGKGTLFATTIQGQFGTPQALSVKVSQLSFPTPNAVKFFSTLLVAATILCESSSARFAPSFSYAELLEMSDFVILMDHESTEEFSASDPDGGSGRVTSAKVLAVMKGEIEMETIKIRHFFYQNSPRAPNHVMFPASNVATCLISTVTPTDRISFSVRPIRQYLAFLKKGPDGSYIPATPQFDSDLSFVPVGGSLNNLWSSHADTGVTNNEESPTTLRVFVEEEPVPLHSSDTSSDAK